MKPYYQREGITLYLGDCREVLPSLAPVDLVLADPPYGKSYRHGQTLNRKGNSKHHGIMIAGDDAPFDPSCFLESPATEGARMVFWGANHYASRLPDSAGWLVWNKRPFMAPCDFSDCELAWTNFLQTVRQFTHQWMGVLRASQVGQKVLHPNEKPIALMEWCLELAGDVESILDPYTGSATTAIACLKTGRQFIGCEIEERYCEIAAERIEKELNQGKLFDAAPMAKPVQLNLQTSLT